MSYHQELGLSGMIIFSVLTLLLILKLIKINKDKDLESAETLHQIRQHLVSRINEWYNTHGLVSERDLTALVVKYELHFTGKYKIDLDVHAGCYQIVISHKWMREDISGYLIPPKWNLENNIEYKVK